MLKLGLGTAQFGMPYGISGDEMPSAETVFQILKFAHQSGIDLLDTAPVYGEAESRLGNFFKDNSQLSFSIITKIDRGPEDRYAQYLANQFDQSLTAMNQKAITGLLFRDLDQFISQYSVIESFYKERLQLGQLQKIGVSVYTPDDVTAIQDFPIQLIQLPINVFNQSFLNSDVLTQLSRSGIDIHVRSVFLQGLFFLDPNALPAHLKALQVPLKQLQTMGRDHQIEVEQLCLGFVDKISDVSKLIIGVQSVQELASNVKQIKTGISEDLWQWVRQTFSGLDPKLVDPRLWAKGVLT